MNHRGTLPCVPSFPTPIVIHLRAISLQETALHVGFPFSIPIIRNLHELDFTTNVTVLVGENGSGKSTLLEAIATAAELTTVGTDSAHTDSTLTHVHALAEQIHLVWNKRTRRGFFMRSEDFFGYVRRMSQMRAALANEIQQIDADYEGRSELARNLAKMAHARELKALQDSYGEGLDAQSHGESYFKLFQQRFKPNGLYLLDEPEAPLSPMRQLTLLSLLNLSVKQDAQFIIATHSPIIMAYPGATLLSCDGDHIQQVQYEDLEHVSVMRSFLEKPQAYLRHLVDGADPSD